MAASVYNKTALGIGYFGKGNYKSSVNGKKTPQYIAWLSMLTRCYSEKYKERQPTYNHCFVCEEWLNYQVFAEWYDANYYEIEGKRGCLDKDIIIKNNGVYSPDTCVFVTQGINGLFTRRQNRRGNCDIGVCFNKKRNKYQTGCSNWHGRVRFLGRFDNQEEAFTAYKTYKELLIKKIAYEYKSEIPRRLFDAMINYVVDAND